MNESRGDTIYALASGAGLAGVAVVRLSGPAAGVALKVLTGRLPEPRRLARAEIGGIDDGLVAWFPAPRSFTGEDVAEFHIHGGRAVIAALQEALSRLPGLRPAAAGEFTRRAFLNGKLDLMEVEGLADLIAARTEAQRSQALAQMQGVQSAVIEGWRADLLWSLARLEAAIDFSDEAHVADEALAGVAARIGALAAELKRALGTAARGEALRDGVRVVIAGPPNAGKSRLLNWLAGREAAIVSDMAGTTRDVIEVQLDLGGVLVLLSDTAGLRAAASAAGRIEIEGMARSRRSLAGADLVLWVEAADARAEQAEAVDSEAIRIWNKADLAPCPAGFAADCSISLANGQGLDRLLARLTDSVAKRFAGGEPALISRERHRAAVAGTAAGLDRAGELIAAGQPLEIVAEQLRLAARALAALTGRIDVEQLLDSIFRDFCIGK